MIYLDHNATTPVDPRVAAVVAEQMRRNFGNPSSRHGVGRAARAALEEARARVAALVAAEPAQVVFTSGGTEANNLALKGFVRAMGVRRLCVSAVEHASVRAPARFLASQGVEMLEIPVDAHGRVTPTALEACLAGAGPTLVSVMAVNNETGVIQDIPALAEVVRRHGGWFHCDAVQAAGKIPLDWRALGVHLLSLSGHKLGAPKGAGALVVDKAVDLEPLFHGGGQERGRRPGTEAVPAWVGFGLAAALAVEERPARERCWRELQQRLEAGLRRRFPEVVIFAESAPRVANTTFFALPGLDGEALLLALDEAGFAVGSGSACGRGEPSYVLQAMGVERELAQGALRVSFGVGDEGGQVNAFLDALEAVVSRLRRFAGVVGV